VTIPAITGADFTAVQDQLKFFHSSGLVTGGVISDNGDGSVNVSAGHGYIRLIDDPTEELYAISWDAE
ncbi:MAG: hypothetical protein GWN01_10000, partial [Nitrosopumilaceae archaeon]|nr:hypothetical protein [Nitrosopumilaceae archaeon]NIU87594.1 hypothetical protein [Nitrosopumilaceae archaeon]NIX61840.1 hypothetical protein [Nitrosopumilaceae archaeon]